MFHSNKKRSMRIKDLLSNLIYSHPQPISNPNMRVSLWAIILKLPGWLTLVGMGLGANRVLTGDESVDLRLIKDEEFVAFDREMNVKELQDRIRIAWKI